jgi:hypothetical protein
VKNFEQNSQPFFESDEEIAQKKFFKDNATCTERNYESKDMPDPTVVDIHGCKYFGQFVSNELLRHNHNDRYAIMQKIKEVLKNNNT